jgi:hypothetical protein
MVAKQQFRPASLRTARIPDDAIREPQAAIQVVQACSSTSRRDLLGALAVAPLAAVSAAEIGRFEAPPAVASELISLLRSREGRHLSRIRYHQAESFFTPIEHGFSVRTSDQLYQVGIVLHLALSSHLLDVGFADAWCAQNIGLHVNKSLERANATGLAYHCPELKAFAEFLSPYGRWRNADVRMNAEVCPFSHERMCRLTRDLLERVREVTGHPRPRGHVARNG